MSDEGMMVGGGGFDLLSRLGHGDVLHKEARREIESLRSRLADVETRMQAQTVLAVSYLNVITEQAGRLAAADALLQLARDYVEANQGGWCRDGVGSGIVLKQINAHLAAAREGEKP